MERIRFQRRERRSAVEAPVHPLPDVLRWMAGTAPPIVVDVRPAKQHDAWSIPGSLSIPAKDLLADGGAELPFDRMVIVVSSDGQRAQEVAAKLRASGRQAGALEHGMEGWGNAWNVARRRLHDLDVVQIRRPATGCLSYLVARRGEAIVVDPCLDPQVYIEQARAVDAHIGSVAETGLHEHGTAAELAHQLSLPLIGPHHVRLAESDALPVGGHVIDAGARQCIDLGEAILTGSGLALQPDEAEDPALLGVLESLDPKVHILPGRADRPPGFDGSVWEAPLHQVRRWHAAA